MGNHTKQSGQARAMSPAESERFRNELAEAGRAVRAAEPGRVERERRHAKATKGTPLELRGALNISTVFTWLNSGIREEREAVRRIVKRLRRVDVEAIREDLARGLSGVAGTPDDPKRTAEFKVKVRAACAAVDAALALAPPSSFKSHKRDDIDRAPLPHQFPAAARRLLRELGFDATGAKVRDLLVGYGLEPVPADSAAAEAARKRWDEAGKSKPKRRPRSRVVPGRKRRK